MATESEGTFKVGDVNLYTKTFTPAEGPVRAKLVIVHGFSDHINVYNELFGALAARGIQTFGFDQRGWGRSVKTKSDRGLTGPTSQVLADIAAFVQDKLPSAEPLFVMGHSMGGGEVITLAADEKYADLVRQVRGWLLEGPFIGFTPNTTPNALKIFAGRITGRLLPHFQMTHAIPGAEITRDPVAAKRIDDDELAHKTGTLEGLASLLDRTNLLQSGVINWTEPPVQALWLGHGGDDKVCDHSKAMEWFERQPVKDKKWKTYEGGYHALHVDLAKDELAKDVGDWILERSAPATAPEAKL